MKKEIIIIPSVSQGFALDINDVNHWDSIPLLVRDRAKQSLGEKGSIIYNPVVGEWQRVERSKIGDKVAKISAILDAPDSVVKKSPARVAAIVANLDEATKDIIKFVHSAPEFKPVDLIMPDLKWKYLIRNIMRGQNIMMVGDSGMGKTVAAMHAAKALQRPQYIIGMGSTQDPRATLIGNTQFNKEDGTFFAESRFVQAIQQENAVIVLDELSRASGEAWNILMPVLDPNQRCLQLDEKPGSPIVKVHPTVSFIATANIGFQYTSTRVMDRAMLDRFTTIEMDLLDKEQELHLLTIKVPEVSKKELKVITDITSDIRSELKSEVPRISTQISTRSAIELGYLLRDGFTLPEAAEIGIYPFYSEDGGAQSERVYIKQLVQKYIKNDNVSDTLTDPF
jgi:nitric oxide reductase NorQ protein